MFEFVTKHEAYISNMVQDINATFNVKLFIKYVGHGYADHQQNW